MLRLMMWILKWVSRIITILRLKKMGWKWLLAGLATMFLLPMLLQNCL